MLTTFPHRLGRCALFALPLAAAVPALADDPVFLPIAPDPLPFATMTASAISADGHTVVGAYTTLSGPSISQAFRWNAQTGMQLLGLLPGGHIQSQALGVSGDGSIVVGDGDTSLWPHQAFRWTAGTGMTVLADYGQATAISPDGATVVGWNFNPNMPSIGNRAFRWTAASGLEILPSLGGVNNSSRGTGLAGPITYGLAYIDSYPTPVVWNGGAPQQLGHLLPTPGYNDTALAATPDGSIIVGAESNLAFRWTSGVMQSLGVLPGTITSRALGVSADGSIVVGYSGGDYPDPGGRRAFYWDLAHGMRDLRQVLLERGAAVENWILVEADAMSPTGAIVGWGVNPTGGYQAFIARPGAECYANCDHSTTPPVLNVNDFICFAFQFSRGYPYANCDGSTTFPQVNVADFICFQQRFAAGCP
jgi:uncharacterized membrane protein